MTAAAADAVPGLDLVGLRRFLDGHAPGLLHGELTGRVVAGGKSNLTYEVSDGIRSVIVRRPPLGHVLSTAHDMLREHRVISALRPTTVPVPKTYAVCSDDAVIGAPFYVMELVRGTPYRRAEELVPLGPERTRAISARMVDTLVGLHAVDPGSVGLEDFGRPKGFLERQVRRWKTQLDASHSRDLPGGQELHALLAERVPGDGDVSVIHGDFRLDNLLVDAQDRVAAVLDWEMATVGDPLTDVALLQVYHQLAGRVSGYQVSDVSLAPGFLSPAELLTRYAESSGRDVSHIGFHLGLAYFKLAVILEGIHYRFSHGQTVGDGFSSVGDAVVPLIDAGREALGKES